MTGALRKRISYAVATIIAAAIASPVSAYYHYTYYLNSGAVHSRFDLTALPNKTVTYYVSDGGPSVFPQNDSFGSVLSQVRQAVSTWNSVATSDIRVAFGGLNAAGTPIASTPGGQVEFIDLPPGLLGMGGPTVSANINPNASFVPIVRSNVYLTKDLTQKPGPSYSEGFFLTTVHEMGHSLGLQHTFTSSAMSTSATRATSLTRPIDADDIAGISVLYPTPSFAAQNGTITGRVTANGVGLHMASVVAIRNGYGAVSALTNPDGTFRMEGVPQGQYYLYAHPLPPGTTSSCTDICAPLDGTGKAIAPSSPFNTIFFPGTTNLLQASTISVTAGQTYSNINFAVQPRNDVPIYGVSIFSFFTSPTGATNVVSPGYLNMGTPGKNNFLAGGNGLATNGKLTNGLSVQIMGGGANIYGTAPYTSNNYTYLNAGVDYGLGASAGPQHLIFGVGNFIYVLPSAVNLVVNPPPYISGVGPNADGTVSVVGTGFAADSFIYFDGLPAAIQSLDYAGGRATVIPPTGASGQNSTVTVYNHDGQNSLFLQANAPVTYAYAASGQPAVSLNPNTLSAGTEALVTISGVNTQFTSGQTLVGFGSSDVFVRNIIVQSPTQVLANVSIPAGAVNTVLEASVISGFQVASQPQAFQITPAIPSQPFVIPVLQNVTTGQTGAYPGATVSLNGLNLSSGSAAPTVLFNGVAATVLSASPNSVTLQIPSSLPIGAAILTVNNGTTTCPPVAVTIDPLPPTIVSIQSAASMPFTTSQPASGGQVVNLYLSGFADPTAVIFPSQVTINVGGVNHPAVEVSSAGNGLFVVRFVLSNLVTTNTQTPVTVYLSNRSSYVATMATSNN
jgi:Matrixin